MKDLNEKLKEANKSGKVFVVTDENLRDLYLDDLLEGLGDFETYYYTCPPGEDAKTVTTYLDLIKALVDRQITKSDTIVALGGGSVGDLAGFAAATYLRGLDVVHVPTTLLAAVDSSIGGKTAINLDEGKNLLGAFHDPLFVHTDTRYFETLKKDQMLDGLGEIIKYGIIYDKDLFNKLEDTSFLDNNLDSLIETCQSIKKEIVSQDPLDQGIRQILNFGHTIGHGIEYLASYELGHGYCVALGIMMIARYSKEKSYCTAKTYKRIVDIFKSYGFETDIEKVFDNYFDIPKDSYKDELIKVIQRDKKARANMINIIVLEEIGQVARIELELDKIGEIICLQ